MTNLPLMGIIALTQMNIPPPKYTVDRLVPCRLADATRVKELFIISQGYHELRAAERDILADFLSNVRIRTLASDSFGWADEIPRLLTGDHSGSPCASGDGLGVPGSEASSGVGPGVAHLGNGRTA